MDGKKTIVQPLSSEEEKLLQIFFILKFQNFSVLVAKDLNKLAN